MVSTANDPQLPSFLLLYYYLNDRRVYLPEDDSDLFELLTHWMYTGTLSALSEYVPHRVEAGILRDKLRCPIFRNCAMLELLVLYAMSIVIYLFNSGTHTNSLLQGQDSRNALLGSITTKPLVGH